MKRAYFFALAVLLFGGSTLFARPINLSEFKGKFKGTVTLVSIAFPTNPLTGPSAMNFRVKKNGRSGELAITSSVIFNGSSVSASNAYAFAKNKTMTISNGAPAVQGLPPVPVGVYSAKKKFISGTAVVGDDIINVTATIKKTKKRAKLTIVHFVIFEGQELYRATYIGKGKVRRQTVTTRRKVTG